MSDNIVVGSKVMLQSGGEAMTVTEIGLTGMCKCVWHDKRGVHQEQLYPMDALIRQEDKEMAL